MKKIFYLFLALPLLLTSCGSDDDTEYTIDTEEIAGVWQFMSANADVKSSNTLVDVALNIALKQYAESQELSNYIFSSTNNQYEGYINGIDEETNEPGPIISETGIYRVSSDSLYLEPSGQNVRAYKLVALTSNSLIIKKNYITELGEWALGTLGEFVGVKINSATATMNYQIME